MRMRWVCLLVLLLPSLAQAQELSFLAGEMEPVGKNDTTYSWQIDFRYNFAKYLAWSASWVNEGHVEGHHRDGAATQLWGRIPLFERRVSLALGGGAYRYFDTQPQPRGGYATVHGWAAIYSASATYYTKTPWFLRLAVNHIQSRDNIDTNMYVLGAGYRLWKNSKDMHNGSAKATGDPTSRTTGDEIMLFFGETVVNSFRHDAGVAAGLEFRKGIADHFDWTLSWINEDNPRVSRRNSFGSQVWLVDAYFDRRFTIGLGAGAYYTPDRKTPGRPTRSAPRDLAGLVTLTTSYRFAKHWFTRFNWNRVVTENKRDADIFVLGVGYRWKE